MVKGSFVMNEFEFEKNENIPEENIEVVNDEALKNDEPSQAEDANEINEVDAIPTISESVTTEIDSSDNLEFSVEDEKNTEKRKFSENVKRKNGTKKYIAIAAVATIVNITILGAIFTFGYNIGSGRIGRMGKANVVEQLNSEVKDITGAKKTINLGNELSTVEISKKVGPAVVGITSKIENVMSIFGMTSVSEGSGSGIIISADGYIVTNNHVIENASTVKVTLNTGTEYEAKVIGADSKTDLAVIKIQPKENLTVAELGDSTTLEVGERAIAIGNPLGLEFFGSTTQGIISAINRSITVDNKTMNVIQTDAAINNGNSGGALVNAYGKVIGINAVKIASSSVEGMGFAIPISEARPVIADLISYGYVKGRPVIGITRYRDVTEYMASRQGWPLGVQIMGTQIGSGADVAGLEQGDIIVKADGKNIKNIDELNKIKDKHKPGDILQIEVYKYNTGLTEKVSIKLSEDRPE